MEMTLIGGGEEPSCLGHCDVLRTKISMWLTPKTGFRKLSILSKIWKWHIWQGVGGHFVCIIMTHGIRESICDSPLNYIPLYYIYIIFLYLYTIFLLTIFPLTIFLYLTIVYHSWTFSTNYWSVCWHNVLLYLTTITAALQNIIFRIN